MNVKYVLDSCVGAVVAAMSWQAYHTDDDQEGPWRGSSGSGDHGGWRQDGWHWDGAGWWYERPSRDRWYHDDWQQGRDSQDEAAWQGQQTRRGSNRPAESSTDDYEEPATKRTKRKKKSSFVPTEATEEEKEWWRWTYQRGATGIVRNTDAAYNNVVTWGQAGPGHYVQNGSWYNETKVVVEGVDCDRGMILCKNPLATDEDDEPRIGAIRPYHLEMLDEYEVEALKIALLGAPPPPPPPPEEGDEEGDPSTGSGGPSSGRGGSGRGGAGSKGSNRASKRPVSLVANPANSGGGGKDKQQGRGTPGKPDYCELANARSAPDINRLREMEKQYKQMEIIWNQFGGDPPPCLQDLGQHLKELKAEVGKQMQQQPRRNEDEIPSGSKAAGSSSASSGATGNKIAKSENRPEFLPPGRAPRDRIYHT